MKHSPMSQTGISFRRLVELVEISFIQLGVFPEMLASVPHVVAIAHFMYKIMISLQLYGQFLTAIGEFR